MKSIKVKLISMFTLIILVIVSATGVMISQIESKALVEDIRSDLKTMAQAQADNIAIQIQSELRCIDALAKDARTTDSTITVQEKTDFFKAEASRMGYEVFAYTDLSGNALLFDGKMTKNNVADREFFQKAKAGELAFSDLIFSKLDGNPVIVFAAPIKVNNRIVGVLYGRKDGLMISDICKNLTYKNTGTTFIINSAGTTVAHRNTDLVLMQDNDIENAKTDPSL